MYLYYNALVRPVGKQDSGGGGGEGGRGGRERKRIKMKKRV